MCYAGGLLEYGVVQEGLESGHIAALGLDVHPSEPIDPHHFLARHPRCEQ
jgi:phosphoglycerate dehydrogenase-like enzyme